MGMSRPRRRRIAIAAAAATVLLSEAGAFAPHGVRRCHSSLTTNDGELYSPGRAVRDPARIRRIRHDERRMTTILPRALPMSGIADCIACGEAFFQHSAAEGSGSLLLASSSGAATFAARLEEAAPLLSKLLHVPTLWSVLSMSSIVTLLVAWEEAIEVRREAKERHTNGLETHHHFVTIDTCLVTWETTLSWLRTEHNPQHAQADKAGHRLHARRGGRSRLHRPVPLRGRHGWSPREFHRRHLGGVSRRRGAGRSSGLFHFAT